LQKAIDRCQRRRILVAPEHFENTGLNHDIVRGGNDVDVVSLERGLAAHLHDRHRAGAREDLGRRANVG
jgi:hypothetical protein